MKNGNHAMKIRIYMNTVEANSNKMGTVCPFQFKDATTFRY